MQCISARHHQEGPRHMLNICRIYHQCRGAAPVCGWQVELPLGDLDYWEIPCSIAATSVTLQPLLFQQMLGRAKRT